MKFQYLSIPSIKIIKNIVCVFMICTGITMYGQEEKEERDSKKKALEQEVETPETPPEEEETEKYWLTKGKFTFLFNQTAFSNWLAGGQNSIGGNTNINYEINYAKNTTTWDNKINISYGLARTENTSLRKTDDRLEFNSILGVDATGYWVYWSYSFFINLRTQLTNGFNYANDPDEAFENSGFFKPAYLSFGPGFVWEKNDNLKFNMSPATSKVTFLGGEVFTYDSGTGTFISSNERTVFGVEPGERSRYELGFYASGYYKFNLMKNISVENTINLYTNYLEDPQNVDINYQLDIAMKINEYFSTNLEFHTIYDDNAFPGFQIREVFGLGINYSF